MIKKFFKRIFKKKIVEKEKVYSVQEETNIEDLTNQELNIINNDKDEIMEEFNLKIKSYKSSKKNPKKVKEAVHPNARGGVNDEDLIGEDYEGENFFVS